MSSIDLALRGVAEERPIPKHRHTMRTIALCISTALAAAATGSFAGTSRNAQPSGHHAADMPTTPFASQTWTVKNCKDSGPDSLRDIIENPMNAKSGDTIDLGELPVRCGMVDSKITLGSEIKVKQDDLYLYGPTEGSVTISGAGTSRVFLHEGYGTLVLNGLSVVEGYFHAVNNAYGGCIESDHGDITLNHVTVENCVVMSDTGFPNGGGVSARHGNVTLIASNVSHNEAKASGTHATFGGGVYSEGSTFAWYSTISHNTAKDGKGGGIASGGITLIASTINDNVGGYGGGISSFGSAMIENATISQNTASKAGGALILDADTTIANSTIAFNKTEQANAPGGIVFYGTSTTDKLTLQSSIISNNTSASANSDIFIYPGYGTLAGANNLVIASNVSNPMVITLTSDPKLGPLQSNGGPTQTHMLMPGSPALGKGNITALPPTFTADQRGPGYPRTTGQNASVDLGAVQFDSIFSDSFNWQF